MSLVLRGVATYKEVREFWDINEVYAMHEILDIRDDLEADEAEKLKQRTKLKR
jgi:hypothetical protein